MAGLFLVLLASFSFSQTKITLTVDDAINVALQNNPEVLTAQKQIDGATGRILQAGRIPNAEFSLTYNETPTNWRLANAGEQDVGLSQTIEFPGKRSARIDVAEQGKSLAEVNLSRRKTIVTSKVKRTYYQALLANEVIRNLEFTISMVTDFLRVVTDRYQAGATTYVDVIRTKVELTRLRNELVEARRDARLRLAELGVLLGQPNDVVMVLTDSLTYEPYLLSEDSTINHYERRSSFLRIADLDTRRSSSVLNLAEKSYLPDFNIGFALQRRPGQVSPSGSNRYLGIQLGLSLPLWFWQGPKGEVQESRALVDISALQLAAARRVVRQRIFSAYRTVIVAGQQVETFETSLLRDAEDELRSGIAAYQNNQIDALNLFDIYRTYRATKFEHARALYNYLAATAELEAAAEVPE